MLPAFLLVDDSPDDRFLIKRAFLRAKLLNPVYEVASGEEAIWYLDGVGKYADRSLYPLPAIILMDLRMPRVSGFDVLRWIKQRPELGAIRLIVLSGSKNPYDWEQAQKLGAHASLNKFGHFDDLVEFSSCFGVQTVWLTQPVIAPQYISEPSCGDLAQN